MTILVDPPAWPAYGRLWSHLISDESLAELHAFAEAAGLPRRGFEGDHYDVPADHVERLVAAGAVVVSSREIVLALKRSGLRMRKRKGDKGIARVQARPFGGEPRTVDLLRSNQPVPECRVFAATAFVVDAGGDLVIAHSVRRGAWGAPGGWREGAESPAQTAAREIAEEVGLEVDPSLLRPVGYERWPIATDPLSRQGSGDLLQVYAVQLPERRPPVAARLDDTDSCRWVTWSEIEEICGGEFWWPLGQALHEAGALTPLSQ